MKDQSDMKNLEEENSKYIEIYGVPNCDFVKINPPGCGYYGQTLKEVETMCSVCKFNKKLYEKEEN